MFACSSTGEKLKPLVIGKSYNPRCFKNVNKGNLPVTYYSNKKAWMTTNAFIDWLRTVNTTMRLQRRHILMFLDNASSHSKELNLSNLTLKFLPANTTSKCFRVAGFPSSDPDTVDSTADDDDDDDDVPLSELARQLNLSPNIDPCFDDSLPTEDDSDDWERELISSYQQESTHESDDEDVSGQSEQEPEQKMTLEETLAEIRRIHASTSATSILSTTQAMITDLEALIVKKKCQKKQCAIDSFC
ncbi:Hypothetical predicted protein, partial [Mytilus galloprovincialis]